MRSGPGSSMNIICSSRLRCLAEAFACCPGTYAQGWLFWTSAVLPMEWFIFAIRRRSSEEQRVYGQHQSIQNGVCERIPALHRQGGEEGSYEGRGAYRYPVAHGLR